MHRPGNRIVPGLRPAARPYGATAPAPLAPILDGPTAGWHLAFAERLRGPLDVAALRTAWDTVTAHQDALRYRVSDCAGIVEPAGAVPLPVEDVAEADLPDRLGVLAGAGFDPADRLWRLGLYRLAPDDHVLAFAGHRAVFDVRAQALLYADLASAYRDARAGRPPELAPLRVVFADYVAWRGWQVNRRGQADLAWWTAHLDGVASRLALPADATSRAARPMRTGHSTVDAPVAAGVGALARSLGATPAAVVLAALGTVLARLTGQADFVVGTPLAGRRPPGFEPLVGSLCDIAPLRLRPDPATGFGVAVRRTRDELLDALAHAGAGLGQVVSALRPAPPVQVLFELVEEPPPALDLAGLTTGPVPVPAPTPVDLTLRCVPDGDRLRLDAAYDADRFAPERIAALLATLGHVLGQAVTSPDRALGEFALRPDDQPVPQREETVLDQVGRRAAIGELGELAVHWAGGWLGTGRTGRYRPDGTVEPAAVPVVRPAVSPELAPGASARSRPA
jgi:mycobactin peptide synthetase MbtE